MGFDFSNVKGESTAKIVTRQARSCVPLNQVYDKLVAAEGNGRWPFVFYYYYLEQLIKKLQSELDPTKAQWETPAWNEAVALIDNEPDDIIEGLRRLQNMYSDHYPSKVYNIKDAIDVLSPILAMK